MFYEALAWELKDVGYPSPTGPAGQLGQECVRGHAEVERVLKEELQDFKNVRL